MSLNCLAANEDKTTILLTMKKGATKLEKSNPVSLQIGKQHKTGEKSAKLLGVYISPDLKWKTNFSKVTKEFNHRLCVIKRLKPYLLKPQLKTVANGIFISKLQ